MSIPSASYKELLKSKDTFTLTVSGSSMQGLGINDGDVVIVDPTIEPSIGDVVISLVDGRYPVIKTYLMKDNKVLLKPANSNDEIIKDRSISLHGVVVGVIQP